MDSAVTTVPSLLKQTASENPDPDPLRSDADLLQGYLGDNSETKNSLKRLLPLCSVEGAENVKKIKHNILDSFENGNIPQTFDAPAEDVIINQDQDLFLGMKITTEAACDFTVVNIPSNSTQKSVDTHQNEETAKKIRDDIAPNSSEKHELIFGKDKVGNKKTSNENETLAIAATSFSSKLSAECISIHEKIRGMDEISMKPVCLSEKQTAQSEQEDEISLEIKKKSNLKTETEDSKKLTNLRKNIREVMAEGQLDATTLAAQRQESERLARVQEQQRLIREIQKQMAAERANNRTQNRVLQILQGQTSLTKNSSVSQSQSSSVSPTDMYIVKGVASEVTFNKSGGFVDVEKIANGNLTPSVSIAPVRRVRLADEMTIPDTEKKEVVTIVDSSSEDDCIVLSDEEEEEEIEDDQQNSGLHANDSFNVPDSQGRVVVNIGHPESEDAIFLAPQIARTIKSHQIGGVRFLYDNIIESTGRFSTSTGFGCILAHSMGLGKTLQIVSFCDIFLRHTNSKSILCIMPINTLQNWVSEFNMWLPENPETCPLKTSGEIRSRNFKLFVLNDQFKSVTARTKVIFEWKKLGGVLLIGYELFRLLSLKISPRKKRGKSIYKDDKVETEFQKKQTEEIYAALVKPGPDLVICDEGHRIKNSHASISVALKQIRTRRRIVLTGYPLQNNLLEYWCMVDFVRPNYLGTKTEFCNMFERPIQNGQCIDSTPQDIKLMRYRAHVLHSLLLGFVQRRSHTVLQNSLPQKQEYVILVKMTSFQRKLYDVFMNEVVRTKTVPNPLKAFAVCCKIWNHPDVLYNFLKKREYDIDLELEDVDPDAKSTEKLNAEKVRSTANKIEVQEKLKEKKVDKKAGQSIITNQEIKIQDKHLQAPEILPLPSSMQYEHLNYMQCGGGSYESENYYEEYSRIFNNSYGMPNNNLHHQFSNTKIYQENQSLHSYGNLIGTDYFNTKVSQNEFEDTRNSNSKLEICLSDKNSSEIVDLDTKEIKKVVTDIDSLKFAENQSTDIRESTEKEKLNSATAINRDTDDKNNAVSKVKDASLLKENNIVPLEKESNKLKEETIPYDWAIEILKGYAPDILENSPKMVVFFCILEESIKLKDRILVFSQSLLTLNLIERFLQKRQIPGQDSYWSKNSTYFRLDGSTSAMEREKLINEFNNNLQIHLFLVSTRAGSLGINLVGANRVVVFDASWNPCHDTQAVCRVYRYGQKKPCFVYRIVMDKCLEKKMYDRQVNKQGMSDRIVDECNPDAHLSMKEVTSLCYDDDDPESDEKNFSSYKDKYLDIVMQHVVTHHSLMLSKKPFHHESLLVDRKEKKLSQAEKRLAQRGYEMEKRAAAKPAYTYNSLGNHNRVLKSADGAIIQRPVASVRPMQVEVPDKVLGSRPGGIRPTRWIPAEVWQRQGMTAQEMTLPLDVVIPTSSGEKSNIVLKTGQKVMVLKSPKGIYMQLETGKIIAIRTSLKINQNREINLDHDKMSRNPTPFRENFTSKLNQKVNNDLGAFSCSTRIPELETNKQKMEPSVNSNHSTKSGVLTSQTVGLTAEQSNIPNAVGKKYSSFPHAKVLSRFSKSETIRNYPINETEKDAKDFYRLNKSLKFQNPKTTENLKTSFSNEPIFSKIPKETTKKRNTNSSSNIPKTHPTTITIDDDNDLPKHIQPLRYLDNTDFNNKSFEFPKSVQTSNNESVCQGAVASAIGRSVGGISDANGQTRLSEELEENARTTSDETKEPVESNANSQTHLLSRSKMPKILNIPAPYPSAYAPHCQPGNAVYKPPAVESNSSKSESSMYQKIFHSSAEFAETTGQEPEAVDAEKQTPAADAPKSDLMDQNSNQYISSVDCRQKMLTSHDLESRSSYYSPIIDSNRFNLPNFGSYQPSFGAFQDTTSQSQFHAQTYGYLPPGHFHMPNTSYAYNYHNPYESSYGGTYVSPPSSHEGYTQPNQYSYGSYDPSQSSTHEHYPYYRYGDWKQ